MRLALMALLVGCGQPAAPDVDAPPTGGDDAPAIDAPVDTVDAYLREVVGKLAGAADIAPGTRIAHRASAAERETVRQYLLAEFAALGIPATRDVYATGTNIVATLAPTGATPGGTIIVGAHYDGVPAGPAAADDGTGVAIVLATARHLRDVPVRNHPFVFALFDEEELGLLGSKAFVDELAAANTDVAGVHIYDMISFDGDGDRAVELWSPSPSMLTLYQQQGALASMPIQPVQFMSSDHAPFRNRGYAAVGVCEEFVGGDHTPTYHTANDTFDHIDFAYTTAVTKLAFAVLDASAP